MFAFLHLMMSMRLIRQDACSSAGTRADNGTDRPTNFRADDGTANRSAADEFCFGVMVRVMTMCLRGGIFV
jgi:hypothetical protein